jgi:hypothetical protein
MIAQTRHAAAPGDFNESSYPVEITPEERTLGIRTKRYFDETLKRQTPWLIKGDRITVTKPASVSAKQETFPGGPLIEELRAQVIHAEQLAKERISPLLASVMFTFKRIEDKLPDFSGQSFGFFRNIWGISNSYHQWSYEENQHSDALGLVLECTGHETKESLDQDYYENLAKTWEPPFPTARMMVLYAAFQEQLTSLNYHALAKKAVEEGAPLVAEVLKLIARDESYHGGGYRAFSKIFHELDPEGTLCDTLHVASNFRMPAQHLMRNLKRNSLEIVRAGAFTKEMVSEDTIYRVLKGLGFVPEGLARKAADSYWS